MPNQEKVFKDLYELHYSQVLRLCMSYVSGDVHQAKDLTQEVFIKVWSNLESFRNESKVTTWIYRIAVNTCLMKLRKKSVNMVYQDEVMPVPSEEERGHLEQEQQFAALYHCIAKLSASNKAIITMELEGLEQKEIADIMGFTHEAVRTRIHRIKKQLAKCVNHD